MSRLARINPKPKARDCDPRLNRIAVAALFGIVWVVTFVIAIAVMSTCQGSPCPGPLEGPAEQLEARP